MEDHRKHDPLAGLLARELKGAKPSANVCPEPDVLAAYFERSLSAAEMTGCETHLAACARCQEQLATMARIETAVAPPKSVAESATGFSWFLNWRWLAPMLAGAGALAIWVVLRPPAPANQVAFEARNRSGASQPAADAAKATSPESARAESKDLNAALEPAKKAPAAPERDAALLGRAKEKEAQGARAADGFAFRAGSDSGRVASTPAAVGALGAAADEKAARALSASGKLAEKTVAAKPAERADRTELSQLPTASREGQKVAGLSPAQAAASAATPATGQEQAPQKKNEPIPAVASTVTVEAVAETVEAKRKEQAVDERAALDKAATQQVAQAKPDAQSTQDQRAKQRAVAAPPAAQAESQMRPSDAVAPAAQEQVRAQRAESAGASGAGPGTLRTAPTAAPSKTEDAPRDADMKQFALRDDRGMLMAGSPTPRPLWRIGPQGRIERFREQGKAWVPQESGVTGDLLAGFAPAEKVCWVVGRAGTILLTTDAGKTWRRLGSPSDADIVAVTATDATSATITLAGGKKYVTADAGRSWKTPN